VNDKEIKEFGEKLRAVTPPLRQAELVRDLWPEFLQKSQEPNARVPWFDWALAALAAGVLIFFPGIIPVLLYHL
jgi:hypothetical protein